MGGRRVLLQLSTGVGISTSSAPVLTQAPERQRENFDVFGFELSHAEIASISSLESGRLWDGDPETNEEF